MGILIIFIVMFMCMIIYGLYLVQKGKNTVYSWARDNEYKIISLKHTFGGPWFWIDSIQFVYRVKLIDKEGVHYKGWIRTSCFSTDRVGINLEKSDKS